MSTAAPRTPFPAGTALGYPRIGRRRELKKALEAFWHGDIDRAELDRRAAELRRTTRERLAALGLGRTDSSIPESFSLYDQVLDAAVAVGVVPADEYFLAARGEGGRAPLEMTKWFDTNYHYLVPEIGPETRFTAVADQLVGAFEEAAADGFTTRPVLVGPVTFLALAKPSGAAPEGFRPLSRLADLIPVYAELLTRLASVGAEWVQLDEPALVSESLPDAPSAVRTAAATAYTALGRLETRPQLFVAAPYAALGDALGALASTPVEAIGLDLVRGSIPADLNNCTADALKTKTLVGGVIDGHNIWRGDLAAAFAKLQLLRDLSPHVSAATSTSLQHVPHDVADEPQLDARLSSWLAFADQKVEQVATLAKGLSRGADAIAGELREASLALADRLGAPGVRVPTVRERLAGLQPGDFERGDYDARVTAQAAATPLPALPTTTIGSFPQTAEIRRARAARVAGSLTPAQYDEAMKAEIARVIALQEELGLDVLVHGEPERNDMVQYFAEHLDGFAVTVNGWVQSYGSRCTRPSILWGDVSRPAPITVDWSSYAQSLTSKPVKGMLTGPVTILAWSFVRDDQPLGDTANQVALALRDEVADLEAAGIAVVQVDEPALRELLPLKKADQDAYLAWSVGSFKLATAGADVATQVHTHLCYSEFGVVIDAIRALDADVTSIEAARSRMEVVDDIARSGFDHGVGPGVWDIHSPRVPSQAELDELLARAVAAVPGSQLWVNPDCGLKTRGYDETIASLTNLVAAARKARELVS